MIVIKKYPKNKKYFIRLKKFAQKIIEACEEIKITPILWGSLAYFGYTKNKRYVIRDIDFLIPVNSIKEIKKILKKKKIKYEYVPDWKSFIVSKGNLQIDLDPFEWYYKGLKKFKEFNFDGLIVKVISLDSLIRIYKRASEVSKDKSEIYSKRFEELKKLR